MRKTSRVPRRPGSEGQLQSGTFAGEEDRVTLIEWLNAANGSRSYQRVNEVIRNIKSATAAMDAADKDGVYFHIGPGPVPLDKQRRRREIAKQLSAISHALRPYVFHPRLTANGSMVKRHLGHRWWFDLSGDPVRTDYKHTRSNGRNVFEADAVFGILRLASYDLLDRVKQCQLCERWLYAAPKHKKFCDEDCQLKYFARSPVQKKKRAWYMRKYRQHPLKREETRSVTQKSSRLSRQI